MASARGARLQREGVGGGRILGLSCMALHGSNVAASSGLWACDAILTFS